MNLKKHKTIEQEQQLKHNTTYNWERDNSLKCQAEAEVTDLEEVEEETIIEVADTEDPLVLKEARIIFLEIVVTRKNTSSIHTHMANNSMLHMPV